MTKQKLCNFLRIDGKFIRKPVENFKTAKQRLDRTLVYVTRLVANIYTIFNQLPNIKSILYTFSSTWDVFKF